MLKNNDFNKGINQINNFQNNSNNDNWLNSLNNVNGNNDSSTYETNFFFKNVIGNGPDVHNNAFDNLNNDLNHFSNFQNKNNLSFFNKDVSNNNSECLFTEIKKNVSIFGNKLKNTPLFSNIEPQNENIHFRFDDFISKDKSIFGNRIKDRKPLFTNNKNDNTILLNGQCATNSINQHIHHLDNQNSSDMSLNCDKNNLSYPYNLCNNNYEEKFINNEINEKNSLFHNIYYPSSLNMEHNSNIKNINPFCSNIITNTPINLTECNETNYSNYNNCHNNLQHPYLYHNINNKDTINPNYSPYNQQHIINTQSNLFNQKNNLSYNEASNLPYKEANNLSKFPNMLQNNNVLPQSNNNFTINNPNINPPNHNSIYTTEHILKQQNNNTNIIPSTTFIGNIEPNINKNELSYDQNKIQQTLNYNLGYNDQIISNNNINNPFEYNANPSFILGADDINPLKETQEENQNYKLNETYYTNENEMLFEKNYIANTQKRVLFFNDKFIKSLELINDHNLNSYNENRSTIYTFPCYESFNNGIFYLKAIEECKNSERFDVDDELYNKIFSKNDLNQMNILKNINGKVGVENINLCVYYPLLHVEKIKFRQDIISESANKSIDANFELGNIPVVI